MPFDSGNFACEALDLFGGWREFLFLYGPLLLAFPYLYFIQTYFAGDAGFAKMTGSDYVMMKWIVGALFFNSIHTVFSIKNTIFMPEYRELFQRLGLTRLKLVGTFVAILLFFLAGTYGLAHFADGNWFMVLFTLTLALLPAFHGTRQQLGLSLLYNRRLLEAGVPGLAYEHLQALEARARRLEHHAWLFFFLSSVIYVNSLFFRIF